jgi:hypothetical protein
MIERPPLRPFDGSLAARRQAERSENLARADRIRAELDRQKRLAPPRYIASNRRAD